MKVSKNRILLAIPVNDSKYTLNLEYWAWPSASLCFIHVMKKFSLSMVIGWLIVFSIVYQWFVYFYSSVVLYQF